MRRLARIVAGRRSKWLVIGVWVVALVALAPLGAKLADETVDDTRSFLPKSAESTAVVRLLDTEFESGETPTASSSTSVPAVSRTPTGREPRRTRRRWRVRSR